MNPSRSLSRTEATQDEKNDSADDCSELPFFEENTKSQLAFLRQHTTAMKENNSDNSLSDDFSKLSLSKENTESDSSSENSHMIYNLMKNGIESFEKTYSDEQLITACSQKDLEEVKRALKGGAHPNTTKSFGGRTPLSDICAHQFPHNRYQKEIILEPLKYNAHYLYKDNNNQTQTLLVFAMENAWADVVKILLKRNAHQDSEVRYCSYQLYKLCEKYTWMNKKRWSKIQSYFMPEKDDNRLNNFLFLDES